MATPLPADAQVSRAQRRPRGVAWPLAATLLACLALLPAAHAQTAQVARIGYVDMKRLLDNAPQVQAGRDALQREFAARDADLKAQEQRLAGLEDRQRREGALLPRAQAEVRAAEIDTLHRSLERLRTKLREDLGARQAEELRLRWDEIQDVIVEFARESQYDLVVQSPVIYASAAIDITDEVLERLRRAAPAAAPR
jgi:outer membrane protein